MSSLPNADKGTLLEIARDSLTLAAHGRPLPEEYPQGENLIQSAGAFVSLHCRARLRGCIGQVFPKLPLVMLVAHCTRAAALEDPRFKPVQPNELHGIEIEISVLSKIENVVPDEIESGKHGLVVSCGSKRGVLLPQVASDFRWTALRFLEETCIKAGLARDAWKDPRTRIEAFTADVFSEKRLASEIGASARENAGGESGSSPF